jgi:catechol 2,3-dioxygenase-like lactoylglutathione lyase family enzyme
MTDAAEGDGRWAALVPELLVADLGRSQEFYCGICGFAVRFSRPEDGFLYLDLGGAQIMLEEVSEEAWITAPLEQPFGRGINLQIEVAEVVPIAARLEAAGIVPFRALHEAWYREGDVEHGQAQLLVQDPDGYVLRFVEVLGERPVSAG